MKSRLFSILFLIFSAVSVAGLANTFVLAKVVANLPESTTEGPADSDPGIDGMDEVLADEPSNGESLDENQDEDLHESQDEEDFGDPDIEDDPGEWSDEWGGYVSDDWEDDIDWFEDDVKDDYTADEESYDKPVEEPSDFNPEEEDNDPYVTENEAADIPGQQLAGAVDNENDIDPKGLFGIFYTDPSNLVGETNESGEDDSFRTQVVNKDPGTLYGDDETGSEDVAADIPDQQFADAIEDENDIDQIELFGISYTEPSSIAGERNESGEDNSFGVQLVDGDPNALQDDTDDDNVTAGIPDQPQADVADNENDTDQTGLSATESGSCTDQSGYSVDTDDMLGGDSYPDTPDTKKNNGSQDSLNVAAGTDTEAENDKEDGTEGLDSKKILALLSRSAKCETTGGFSVQDDRFIIRTGDAEEQSVIFGLDCFEGWGGTSLAFSISMQWDGELSNGTVVEVLINVDKTSDEALSYCYCFNSDTGPETVRLGIEGASDVEIRIINKTNHEIQVTFADPRVL